MIKLYHYIHCPFCLRVRMALGLLEKEWESHPLPYNDEQTPKELTGVKLLPIFQFEDGTALNESLEIIRKIDVENKLSGNLLDKEELKLEIDKLLDDIGRPVHNLCMPYWVWTKEFDEESREYFLSKKEKKRGPFHLLVQRQDEFLNELPPLFERIRSKLSPFYRSDSPTILDIMIASHLWGLYVLPEFQFPSDIHDYLQKVKTLCHFNYHEDLWKSASRTF